MGERVGRGERHWCIGLGLGLLALSACGSGDLDTPFTLNKRTLAPRAAVKDAQAPSDDGEMAPADTDQDDSGAPGDDAGTGAPPVMERPPPTTTGSFATMKLDTASASLRPSGSATVRITLAPTSATHVTVSASGLPAGVMAAFDTSELDLNPPTESAVRLTLTASSTAADANVQAQVTVSSGTDSVSAKLSVSVQGAVVFKIPANIASLPNQPFGPTLTVSAPTISSSKPLVVRFQNLAPKAYEIHAAGTNGFFHSTAGIPPNGGFDTDRKVTAKGTYSFYVHELGSAKTTGTLVIQ